ncbi:MAG: ChrR family anti-sigma-E factor [Methyloligellaceae bacterium]
MKIKQHLDISTLMSFSSGSLSEPLSAVVAAHLDLCNSCRSQLEELDVLGSVLMETLEPSELDQPAPEPELAFGSRRNHGIDRATHSGGGETVDFIARIRALKEGDSSAVKWRWMGPGIHYAKLPLSKDVEGDLRLLKIAPGQKLPEHGHNGTELTLVLSGAYRDETGHYGPGDISDLDEDVEHQPIVEPGQDCICLIGFDESARFKGVMSRIMQPLSGM